MKQYTSCFVGVPLPKKFQNGYEKLLADVGKLYPNWEIAYPKTPHVTVFYLDKQSQYVLTTIASVIQTKINICRNLILTISGFNYFTKGSAKEGIVFLDIVYPSAFANFNQVLKGKLDQYYSADNNLPFHPHMTLARVKGLKNGSSLKNSVSRIESKISNTNWEFSITEIVLYGVDSTKKPQHQEKLITIPAK